MSEQQQTQEQPAAPAAPPAPDHQARMRQASGNVTSGDPLVSFLYCLLRDHLTAGKIEDLMMTLGTPTQDVVYSNGWLAQYAADIATRLRTPSPFYKPGTDTPFSLLFEWKKVLRNGEAAVSPVTKVYAEGKQLGVLAGVRFEANSGNAIPEIELSQVDFPADKLPNMTRITELREKFPWMKITLLPYVEPEAPSRDVVAVMDSTSEG